MAKSAEQEHNTKNPTSMTELRDRLLMVFGQLLRGETDTQEAKQIANVAGKIIKSVAVHCEYSALRKEVPNLPFMK